VQQNREKQQTVFGLDAGIIGIGSIRTGIGKFRLPSVALDGRLEMWEWQGDGSFAGITFRFVQKLIEFHKLFRLRRPVSFSSSAAVSLALSPSVSFARCSSLYRCPSLALFADSLFQMLI